MTNRSMRDASDLRLRPGHLPGIELAVIFGLRPENRRQETPHYNPHFRELIRPENLRGLMI